MKEKEYSEEEIREDRLKQKRIQVVCDYAIYIIRTKKDLTLLEAEKIVEEVKNYVLKIFPDKEETFNIIYLPRFKREIEKRFTLN